MDTRAKIVEALRVPAGEMRPVCIVIGYFDPVVADHAEELPSDQYVIAAVDDLPDPLLDLPARLELVASLRKVAQVIRSVPESIPPDVMVRDVRQRHLEIRNRVMERVRSRAGGQ